MKKCFLSKTNESSCASDVVSRQQLTQDDIRILRLRSRCKKRIKYVCVSHFKRFLHDFASHQKKCCDPFEEHAGNPPAAKKAKATRSLFEITLQLRDKAKPLGFSLIPGEKLCVKCKVRIYNSIASQKSNDGTAPQEVAVALQTTPVFSSQSEHSSQKSECTPNVAATGEHNTAQSLQSRGVSNEDQLSFDTSCIDLEGINKWLVNLGLTPISHKKIKRQENYREKVLTKLKTALEKCSSLKFKENEDSIYYSEMIQQLKSYIEMNKGSSNKIILALTVLPFSMSVAKIEEVFGVSNYLARKSRGIVKDFGILSEPGKKCGRSLSQETINKVLSFYYRDDVSRPLPGRKDKVSVKEDGKRTDKRARLVLGTLGSLYSQYLKEHPNHQLSCGKFCQLRPKECVLAGHSGTHVICVCTYHENPELMFEHGNLKTGDLKAVRDCRALMLCADPRRECFLRQCQNCPDTKLQETLQIHFDSEMVESVTYNLWESTDRGNIITLTDATDDFISKFVSQVESLIPHDYIYKEQANFFTNLKENLKEGEVLVSLDFGENFTVVIQRSTQSNYFSGKQITVHPFVCYFKENGELKHDTFVIISDHLAHNTAAVHVFQKKLIRHLQDTLNMKVQKVYYQSDGCAAQYKNKKAVANVWFHKQDFGIPAEWHYHATAHGKCACDGVTGRVKQLVYQHSLRATKPEDLITDAIAMAQWLQTNVKGITTNYVSSSEVVAHEVELEVRFGTACDIDKIQSHHAIIPMENSPHIMMKVLSNDVDYVLRKVSMREIQIDFDDVKGFVFYSEDKANINLGNVLDSDIFSETFSIQALEPTNKPFSYRFCEDTKDILLNHILGTVAPYFQKGGTIVKVFAKDLKAAQVKCKAKYRS